MIRDPFGKYARVAGAAFCLAGILMLSHCSRKNGDIVGPATLDKAILPGYVPLDPAKPADTLRVATLNLSVGFPVSQLLFKNMAVDTIAYDALLEMYAAYAKGNANDRIKSMAKSIVTEDLDVVGLQEVMILHRTDTLEADFLAELVAEIQALGGPRYASYKTVMNDTSLTGRRGGDSIVLGFSEGNAILVKPEFQILDSTRMTYFSLLPIPIDGAPPTERGFDMLRLKSPGGIEFQVMNTHLEVFLQYSSSQANELVKNSDSLAHRYPSPEPDTQYVRIHPQIILGDFNAAPGKDAHRAVTEGGFKDTFDGVNLDSGGTCCVAGSALWRPDTTFSGRRIDFIMARNIVKAVDSWTAAKTPFVASDGARYLPSDHRLVAARLIIQ